MEPGPGRREPDRTPLPGTEAAERRKPTSDARPDPEVRAAAIRSEVDARRNGHSEVGSAVAPPRREVSVSLDAFAPVARELTEKVAEEIHNEILFVIRRHGTNAAASLLALEQAKVTLLIIERRRLGLPLS
jgi:hypothetical protein